MILVANGCSHTAGAELEYPSQRRCYDKAWPKHLADLLDYDHLNLSDSGASSHRVVRTTIRYVIDQFKQKNNLQDHLFIINWPGAYRTELKLPQNASVIEKPLFYDDGWLPIIIGNDESYKLSFSNRLYKWYKLWVINSEPIAPRMNYLHDILLLQSFLSQYRVKFLFWTAAYVDIPKNKELSGYEGLISKTTYPFFTDVNMSYNVLMHSNNQQISKYSIQGGTAAHYDEEAQVWFANYLHSYLANNSFI